MSKQLSVVPLQAQPVQGTPAGLVSRSLAAVVDGVVVVLVLIASYVGWNALRFLVSPREFAFSETRLLLGLAAGWTLSVLYLAAAWTLTGRSYGCHVMGLRVTDRHGRRLRLWRALLRAVLYASVPIGLLWSARGGAHASLQDVVVGSRVVYAWEQRDAVPPQSSPRDEARPLRGNEPETSH